MKARIRKFGLIGYPLGHSFSKQFFHDKFLEDSVTDSIYDNYELSSINQLDQLISENPDLCGLNVTIPYKTEVLSRLDFIAEDAKGVGAVNVIKIANTAGKVVLKGFNTDIYGFVESLSPYLNKSVKRALILGTGGSSKAVAWVCGRLGITYTHVSRNPDKGAISYHDLTDKVLSDNQLIINTTPLGMFPDVNTKPDLCYESLNNSHILYDLVYNPEITRFLESGRERGCTVIGGYRMLRLQAEKSWEIWNDNTY